MGTNVEVRHGMPEGEGVCLETEHFLVFADKAKESAALHFSDLLEGKYLKIHEDFHFPLTAKNAEGLESACGTTASRDKLRCYLCGGVPEYLMRTGKRAEDYEPWMIGFADSAQGIICLLLPEDGGEERQGEKGEGCWEEGQATAELEKIAVHELVHIVFDRHCGVTDGEAWLNEGIAILYAGQTDLGYVSEKDCPAILALGGRCLDGETPEEFADNGGYDYAGIYVWYFIRNFGLETFLAAYKNEINAYGLLGEGFEREAVGAYRREAG